MAFEKIKLCHFTIEEGLNFINTRNDTRRYEVVSVKGKTYNFVTNSLRLRCFKTKGTICLRCGLKATSWMLYRGNHSNLAHLALVAETNNGLIQITIDHIIPKSKGGGNSLLNVQPYCSKCNCLKGSKTEVDLVWHDRFKPINHPSRQKPQLMCVVCYDNYPLGLFYSEDRSQRGIEAFMSMPFQTFQDYCKAAQTFPVLPTTCERERFSIRPLYAQKAETNLYWPPELIQSDSQV